MSQSPTPDFRIITVVYNNHIVARMIKAGFVTRKEANIKQLLDEMGARSSYGAEKKKADVRASRAFTSRLTSEVHRIIGLKQAPTDEEGAWLPTALAIAKTLEAEPEDLWPGDLKTRVPRVSNETLFASVGTQASYLVMAGPGDA